MIFWISIMTQPAGLVMMLTGSGRRQLYSEFMKTPIAALGDGR